MRTIPGSALQATAVLILVVVGGGLGAPVPPVEYVFVPWTESRVALERHGACDIGRFDPRGNFVVERRVQMKELSEEMSTKNPYTLWSLQKPYEVYEFRSERLIKGTLEKDFNFVPHVGATVIHFKDYKYSPDGIKIWNLPGYFEKKPTPKPPTEAKPR